jgi:hypothetical protein
MADLSGPIAVLWASEPAIEDQSSGVGRSSQTITCGVIAAPRDSFDIEVVDIQDCVALCRSAICRFPPCEGLIASQRAGTRRIHDGFLSACSYPRGTVIEPYRTAAEASLRIAGWEVQFRTSAAAVNQKPVTKRN